MNPINLAKEVQERYARYLKTTFYLKDPALRQSFEKALESGHLSKGPYLEATPVFKKSKTTRNLFKELLGFEPDESLLHSVQGNRLLYLHQEEAIQAVVKGQNVVVATGTGSGKTEAFLYPIILHLYQEFQAGRLGQGVRALVLYPMNALANDQRVRLGQICEVLRDRNASFRFTFGQYIGETPEDKNDSIRKAREHLDRRLPGELVLRSEIRQHPPHILLTNYSMLEYLLLRPQDTPLFHQDNAKSWSFLVVDEAHQYQGSRGTEMSMLIRRLKQRLREEGCSNSLCCIATSATLGREEEDRAAIARFASNLFGEDFNTGNAILLKEVPPTAKASSRALDIGDYQYLFDIINGYVVPIDAQINELGDKVEVSIDSNESLESKIGRILESDARAVALQVSIRGNPTDVHQIADRLFGDIGSGEERLQQLVQVIHVMQKAVDPNTGSPLLSARYHFFLRSLEGAFLGYLPEKQIFIERRSETREGAVFEIAVCRECGQHYLVGRILHDRLVEAIRDPGSPEFEALYFKPIDDPSDEQDEEYDFGEDKVLKLCLHCGKICQNRATLVCGHGTTIYVKQYEGAVEREGQIPQCPVCEYRGPDPVREIVHGTDGPHAVIATTLYQNLPASRKKILAFSDGRQDAAFFAWYLEKSYKDVLNRNLTFEVANNLSMHTSHGLSFSELALGLRDIFRERSVFPPSTGDLDLLRHAWLTCYREFLSDQPRISLEGVGLARWTIEWPDWFKVPGVLLDTPWSLTKEEALDLVLLLLHTMRTDGAAELRTGPGVSMNWSDLEIQSSQLTVVMGPPRSNKSLRSWEGVMGKRAQLLVKLQMRIHSNVTTERAREAAVEALKYIWGSLKECDKDATSASDRILLLIDEGRRLNPDWWRFRPIQQEDTLYQCNVCGRIQSIFVRGICTRYRCKGTLHSIRASDLELNHYRSLYETDLPGSLRVEEHTAQLEKDKAREYQSGFRDGNINILSCSTTFELGVDLGDLDVIFLRNVPPETFNYVQRVGRSGRRGNPGFAITYCRRGPHDLFHFAEPERMLSGRIQPPTLTTHNDQIILRHIAAWAISAFFRSSSNRFGSVEQLFGDLSNPTGTSAFSGFLVEHQAELEQSFSNIIPVSVVDKLGLDDGSWMQKIAGVSSRFALAEAEVSADYHTVKSLEDASSKKRDYVKAKWARDRAQTIAGEDVPSFLSRKVVIPKYGFPVDVVELDTQRTQKNEEAKGVLLQRDLSLAIAEFAPTSRLVVNKKEWTSYGLKRVAGKEWPRKRYKKCSRHNVFVQWAEGDPEPPMPCGDDGVGMHSYPYIEPQFGFITGIERPKDPKSRPIRAFTTRPYFVGITEEHAEIIDIPQDNPVMTITKSSTGNMVILCEGRRGEGFYICGKCGAGFREKMRKPKHFTPYGQECNGTLECVSLGHEFRTDVIQLQFHRVPPDRIEPIWFAYSLAFALVEGTARVLEVPSTDLNTTVSFGHDVVPPIILYDNVPGGAALVDQLGQPNVLRASLENALERVNGKCGCGEDASCYGCLRNYRNQFAHQNLQRGSVMRFLGNVLSLWR